MKILVNKVSGEPFRGLLDLQSTLLILRGGSEAQFEILFGNGMSVEWFEGTGSQCIEHLSIVLAANFLEFLSSH